MANIVTVNISITKAPKPATLQRTGALVSQGATTLAPGSSSLLTQASDLTPLLAGAAAVTGITQTAGLATAVCTNPHGIVVGDTVPLTIAGAVPSAYVGTFSCTATTANNFTFAVPSGTTSPATGTIVYTPEDVSELLAMVTTYFGQGSYVAVYVLELGIGSAAEGVIALSAYITAHPNSAYTPGALGYFYSYLVPRYWASESTYWAFLASFESPLAKTYFFTTATLANYANFTNLMKCALVMIEAPAYSAWVQNSLTGISQNSTSLIVTALTTTAHGVLPGQAFTLAGVLPAGYNGTWYALPGTSGSTLLFQATATIGAETQLGHLNASTYVSAGVPSTEFSMAAMFHQALAYAPSSTDLVGPLAFQYAFGVTPFPLPGNAALLQTLENANVNVIGTGAEGGISTALFWYGTTMDGHDFSWWYSIDWMQINQDINITNEVINGSNNPTNPLYYNQTGVNRLQARAVQTAKSSISFGMSLGQLVTTTLDPDTFQQNVDAGAYLGQVVVNAVPFSTWLAANPNTYVIGEYGGLSVSYAPSVGFRSIVFNINVSELG